MSYASLLARGALRGRSALARRSSVLFVSLAGVAAVTLAMIFPAMVTAGEPSGPAVFGPNGKFSVEGGRYDGDGAALALGSYTIPLGRSYGLQFDGALGRIDDKTLYGAGVHLFARDPSKYLLGVYASDHTWDSIYIWRTAVEAELYLNRFTLATLAGIENVNVPTTLGGLPVLNQDDRHFFGRLDIAYYPTDNLKFSVGYHYLNETRLGAAGVEYLLTGSGTPVSLFGEATYGHHDYTRVTAGVKIYFGGDTRKTLMTRQRTGDPPNYTPLFPSIAAVADPTIRSCPINTCIEGYVPCTCPPGSQLGQSDVCNICFVAP